MQLNLTEILNVLPHRSPMLMIDGIMSLVPQESAHACKHLSIEEPCLQGHFPGRPIFPGVLIVEAIAQTACVLVAYSFDSKLEMRLPYLVGIKDARFCRPVYPGDRIDLHVTRTKIWGAFWQLRGSASVRGELVAEATLLATLVEQPASIIESAAEGLVEGAVPAAH